MGSSSIAGKDINHEGHEGTRSSAGVKKQVPPGSPGSRVGMTACLVFAQNSRLPPASRDHNFAQDDKNPG